MADRRSPFLAVVLALSAALAGPKAAAGQVPTPSPKSAPPAAVAAPSVTAQTRPLDVGSVVAETLAPGDAVWPESRYYDTYDLVRRAGSTVSVDLRSEDFDAVLYLIGSFQLTFDDDGAGGCDARIRVTFPVDGTYTLLASSYHRDEEGSYTLSVTNREAATLDGTCSTSGVAPAEPPPPPNQTCVATQWMEWLTLAADPSGGPDFPVLQARERTACELRLDARSGDTWPNGRTAMQFDAWFYPNGRTANQFGAWYYPDGQVAFQFNAWFYPSGRVARQFDNWYLPDGTRTSVAGVVEYALARLPADRGEELLASYRSSTGEWQSLMLIVMASEASR